MKPFVYQPQVAWDYVYSVPFNIWFWPAAVIFCLAFGFMIAFMQKLNRDGDEDYAEDILTLRRVLLLAWIWPLWGLWALIRWIPVFVRWFFGSMAKAKELS